MFLLSKYEYHGIIFFFNEILDLEKKKADTSLQRGYLKINKCHTTNTVFNKKN